MFSVRGAGSGDFPDGYPNDPAAYTLNPSGINNSLEG